MSKSKPPYIDVFIEQALLGHDRFRKRYHFKPQYKRLLKRRKYYNGLFDFTHENIKKLEQVNNTLAIAYKQAYKQAEDFETNIKSAIKAKTPYIIDYEIDLKLHLWSPQKYKAFEDMDGNPFYSDSLSIGFSKQQVEIEDLDFKHYLLDENHNIFYNSDHPLSGQFHCWPFHVLYDHTALSWQDLVDVETIEFDVVLNIQNEVAVLKPYN